MAPLDFNNLDEPLIPPNAWRVHRDEPAPEWLTRGALGHEAEAPAEDGQPDAIGKQPEQTEAEPVHEAEPEPQQPRADTGPTLSRSYRQVELEQLAEYIGEIARRVLGSPIEAESTATTLRFGTRRGNISVEIDGPKKGTWYDHLTCEGGGVPQLIIIKGGVARGAVNDWLRENLGIEIEGWRAKRRLVTSYIYRDEAGNPLARKNRWEPKWFSWESADGAGGWTGGKGCMNGVRRVLYRLPEIKAAPDSAAVFVVEGEKDADNGAALGLVTTCNPDGGSKTQVGKPGKWRPEFSESLRGRNVVIIPDNDEVGAAHARTVATELTRAGCRVAIVRLPHGKDLTEWLDAGGTRAELDALVAASTLFAPSDEELVRAAETRKPRKPQPGDESGAVSPRGLPVIIYAGGKLAEATDRAEELLAAADPELYQRGDFLVRIGRDEEIETADGEKVRGARLVRVDSMHLQDRMNRVVEFMKWNVKEGDYKPINPPPDVSMALMQRTGLRPNIPFVSGIATAPLWRDDGSILTAPGFDKTSGMLYAPTPGIIFPPVSDKPSIDDARAALADVLDLLSEFPFTLESGEPAINVPSPSRSVALCTIVTPLTRHALPTAPIDAIDATAAGSGKSLLSRIASTIARGHAAPVIAGGSDINPEEFEKKISASLIAGDTIIIVDNIEGQLSSELLCSAATESMLNIRVLGLSKHARVANRAVFIVNGNRLRIVGDLVRRTIRCSIDPKVDRPELRTFAKPNPVLRVMENRGRYVHAVLTMLRAFHVAGRPKQTEPLGSFEQWSALVRDMLIWLGESDPCETMERMREQDPRRKALADVMYGWEWVVGVGVEVTAKQLIERAEEREAPASPTDFNTRSYLHPEFREAIMAVAPGKPAGIDGLRFGQWIARNSMRFVDGIRIEPGLTGGDHSGSPRWRLIKA